MVNERGQAFSVFELMIAGVVAFAILIILLSVISGVIFNPTGNPKDAISTTLKTIGRSGSGLTDTFQIKSNTTLLASNFNDKTALDAQSIMFFSGQFKSNSLLTVDKTSNGVSYVTWKGAQPLNARAQVICGATAQEASDAISILDSSKYDYSSSDLMSYCGDAQPCCAVVLDKP